ncbi:MAG TPA: DUF6588 family protein, partial [Bacteroidota bacterium]|nr:DUF6588 family protein [Bacteroidota bacterium]
SYTATYTDPAPPHATLTNPIAFDISGKNTVRATLGATLSLGVFKVYTDYSFASQSVLVLGLGFGI